MMKLALVFVLGATTSMLAQVASPSLTQGIVDTLLGVIAMGIWKLVAQARILLKSVHQSSVRGDRHEHRLNDHQSRLHKLDQGEEQPYIE